MHKSLAILLFWAGAALAQEPSTKKTPQVSAPRARLSSTAQRNENVAVYQIDNNAIREANIRIGTRTTIPSTSPVEAGAYATEHGQSAGENLYLAAPPATAGWHADVFASHQNSVFNARTFFQVGAVLPSRRNHYGFRAAGDAGWLGSLTFTGAQRKIRGMVNGNVLVPLASERTPLATDPAVRALVSRFLNAYPAMLPNRLDFDPRALNTNAPQTINETDATVRLDRAIAGGRLSASHTLIRQHTQAFQLVAGQNPDTDIHSHRSRLTWTRALDSNTDLSLGIGFQRTRSGLFPEPNAVGPRVRMGFQIEELGPDSQFPVDRAQNSFRYGAAMAHRSAAHAFTLGGDLTRFQLNGIETNNQRGYFQFTNNFGRSAIDNLRLGTPTTYEVTIGELSRGYRNWSGALYAGDRWRVSPRLQLYYGLRYGFDTAPSEVHDRNPAPYVCDCNNFSPRLSLALQLPDGWTMRASSHVAFGQIPAVTYQQVRNNLPYVRYVQLQNPDLLDPLKGIGLNTPGRSSPTVLAPDLVDPYSYQYSLAFERRLFDRYLLRAGYIGSRTFKLLNSFILNRAAPVDGVDMTTATVDQRRPDSRYWEVKHVVNGGIAYFDAAQISLDLPLHKGLAGSVSYTFAKAIDEGPDFSSTAANRDMLTARSQSQYESFGDRRGLSNFDSPHSLSLNYSYDLPGPRQGLLSQWQVSGAALWKVGTPLTLFIGSDAPGFGNVDGGPSDRPNIVDASILGSTISHPNVAPLILSRNRFAYIQPGENRGSLGRNTFRKAGIANLNAAVTKQWHWPGHREWLGQFRAEAYNLSNTPQFDEPQRNYSAPAFGKITNTLNDGRVLQLGLRFTL